MPWSAALLPGGCPGYLLEAVHREKAEKLVNALGVENLAELRSRLRKRAGGLQKIFGSRNPFYDPFQGLKPELIGTK
jgi:hypothetical protein